MAGRAHAAGYRSASTLPRRGPARDPALAAIADVNPTFAADTARRFGFERAEGAEDGVLWTTWWSASVWPTALPPRSSNCSAPTSPGRSRLARPPRTPKAMVTRGQGVGPRDRHRVRVPPLPAIGAIREQLASGAMGRPLRFNGHYWCDYGVDPPGPR